MTGNVSKADVKYFGQFLEGYNPYSPEDLELVVGTLAEMLQVSQALRFVEVGCASGQFSSELAQRIRTGAPIEYFGLDIARAVLAKYPFHKVCGTAFSMPLKNRSVDIVCCPASLHHLAPFEMALGEIDRILKPGGLFYCIEPNYYHPHRRFFMQYQRMYRLYRDANDVPIRPDWLEQQMQARGYSTVMNRLINLTFQKPGLLQKAQNILVRLRWPYGMHRWIYPWFIFAARKST